MPLLQEISYASVPTLQERRTERQGGKMSHNEEEIAREHFKTFLDFNKLLQQEIEQYEPSKVKIKRILKTMLELIK